MDTIPRRISSLRSDITKSVSLVRGWQRTASRQPALTESLFPCITPIKCIRDQPMHDVLLQFGSLVSLGNLIDINSKVRTDQVQGLVAITMTPHLPDFLLLSPEATDLNWRNHVAPLCESSLPTQAQSHLAAKSTRSSGSPPKYSKKPLDIYRSIRNFEATPRQGSLSRITQSVSL